MGDVFKVKKNRESSAANSSKSKGTLDSLHQSHIESLLKKTEPDSIASLEDHLRELQAKVAAIPEGSFEFEHVLARSELEKEIGGVQETLDRAMQRTELTDYYLQNGDIMLEYYAKPKKAAVPKMNLLSQSGGGMVTTFDKLFQPVDTEAAPTKKKIFDEYAQRMGLSNGMTAVDAAESLKKMAEHCSTCNMPREELTAEGILVCPKCGSEEYALVVSDSPGFRDPPKERNNYAYKKMNHLNEILNQFQAKESTKIPEEVMSEVICEIKKRRIENIASLTEQNIRDILKKLERNRYYEHATHILSRLNGNPPPTITAEIEEKIRAMFQEIQAPFLLYCPDDRRNFLSYAYIIYKFLELLELDEYKVHFTLLKSRDRLISHDQIWKKICDYLQWEFIQSV
jgi:uncharacterized Zn finger protein (UPF0148 family)